MKVIILIKFVKTAKTDHLTLKLVPCSSFISLKHSTAVTSIYINFSKHSQWIA